MQARGGAGERGKGPMVPAHKTYVYVLGFLRARYNNLARRVDSTLTGKLTKLILQRAEP